MGEEIVKPSNRTYWIITNGTNYRDGVTGVGEIILFGYGWVIFWQGTDYSEYIIQCQGVGITPEASPNKVNWPLNLKL